MCVITSDLNTKQDIYVITNFLHKGKNLAKTKITKYSNNNSSILYLHTIYIRPRVIVISLIINNITFLLLLSAVSNNALCFTSIHVVIPLWTGAEFPLSVVRWLADNRTDGVIL